MEQIGVLLMEDNLGFMSTDNHILEGGYIPNPLSLSIEIIIVEGE